LIEIDWSQIRAIGGSQAAGFEELCSRLAESEVKARFTRKGAPDAGVECFVAHDDGSEWAWQAKYFHTLGDTQWAQIDHSVKTALDKHPRLTRYYLCVPYDRPDARLEGKKSALDKWNEYVIKWEQIAKDRSMSVEFFYWGSSELLERLSKPEHAGRVLFWFGTPAFDLPWFERRLQESIASADERYTPEIHVDLPIADEFELFGRTEHSVTKARGLARVIRKHWRACALSWLTEHLGEIELPQLLNQEISDLLEHFYVLQVDPGGETPYRELAEKIGSAEQLIKKLIAECERLEAEREAQGPLDKDTERNTDANSLQSKVRALQSLMHVMQAAKIDLIHKARTSDPNVMILRGDAGTGKTHLLCDIAANRLKSGLPTVLLMGQRFTTSASPWAQLLQMLDLPNATAEEFVGALESSAQAAGARALLIIDAVNEGEGRKIWPSHLDSLLETVSRSPWIATVLSIRTRYEDCILSKSVRERAITILHRGFQGQEYNALTSFFQWYGIEMPSTPLLDPEFSNPLFLKTLCKGLKHTGQSRLPRGHHGITWVFNLYLDAVQLNLNSVLDLNPQAKHVRKAVELFAVTLANSRQRWIQQSEAEELINSLLPGRDFSRSLYRGLVDEGVLTVDRGYPTRGEEDEIVYLAYERLADHHVVSALLNCHLDSSNPAAAFGVSGPLHYLVSGDEYIPPGVLEALSVQIPELCSTEFAKLVPDTAKLSELESAFANSIVWRSPDAFNDDTLPTLDLMTRNWGGLDCVLDALVTVATLPDHRLNAKFLDDWLVSYEMPDRDAWWSIYVHYAWENEGPLYRTVEWAWCRLPEEELDNEVVDLAATVLSWMLTTSNRFARDRATKALVALLTGRIDRMYELVNRFSNVTDIYVAERIYAVAYGVAMRCNDCSQVDKLANLVFEKVFAGGLPLPHILLRDYARGVVERAISLGSNLGPVENLVRPPYKSEWPEIPSDDDVRQKSKIEDDGTVQNRKSGGRDRIFGSVSGFGDFARYVIGTNGPYTDWLSLRLEEPRWKSRKDELEELLAGFSEAEQEAYRHYREQNTSLIEGLSSEQLEAVFLVYRTENSSSTEEHSDATEKDEEVKVLIGGIERDWKAAQTSLGALLTEEHANQLETILNRPAETENRHGPRFDLSIIQRYVTWRVFDLGWTSERFDRFDCFAAREHGRSSRKVERIGKKYQWIAFHEIQALIADHFQFSEHFGSESQTDSYLGPWQVGVRDIDPSCTLKSSIGGTSYDAHESTWWAPVTYNSWADVSQEAKWAADCDDLPVLESLLIVTDPSGQRWVNLEGAFQWKQEVPEHLESSEFDHQGIRCYCDAILVREADANSFADWAKDINFETQRMPEAPTNYRLFLGEHPWSPAAQFMRRPYEGEEGWTRPAHDCPVDVRVPVFEYLKESSTFDCSVDDGYTLRLPSWDLFDGLRLQVSGRDAQYINTGGELIAFDPTATAKGPSALLVKYDAIQEYLAREQLVLYFCISGEKRLYLQDYGESLPQWTSITGLYRLTTSGVEGFYKGILQN